MQLGFYPVARRSLGRFTAHGPRSIRYEVSYRHSTRSWTSVAIDSDGVHWLGESETLYGAQRLAQDHADQKSSS